MSRTIDGEALLGIERLLDTDIVRQSKTASWLLAQVLYDIQAMPTLTPPNEWVNRVRELDELYTKLQIVTGFTAEQLLEIFAAGYTLKKPDYSKKFAEMENLAEAAQPNEPLTPCDVCRFSPPSSGDGKPCCMCPAERRPPEGEA